MDEKILADGRKAFAEAKKDFDEEAERLWKEMDYDTKLLLTGYIFSKIREHIKNPGSYRYLIYERLGFNTNAYACLYMCGGMDISNGCHTINDEYRRLAEDDENSD